MSGPSPAGQHPGAPAVDTRAEIERLRRLLETQPIALMRVARDGVIHAANDAAQRLLDVDHLGAVLDHNLKEWLPESCHGSWETFADRAATGAGTLECELKPQTGEPTHVMFDAVPFASHYDGVESSLLIVQNRPAPKNREAQKEQARLQKIVSDLEAERKATASEQLQLALRITELETERAQAVEERARLAESSRHLTSDQEQLGQDRDRLVQRVQQLEGERDQAAAERQRLETECQRLSTDRERLEQLERDLGQRTHAHAELTQRVQQLVNERDRATAERQRLETECQRLSADRERIGDLERDLKHRTQTHEELTRRLRELGAEHTRRLEEYRALEGRLQSTETQWRERTAVAKRELTAATQALTETKTALEQVQLEHRDFEDALRQTIQEREQLRRIIDTAEIQIKNMEAASASERERLERALKETSSRRERLAKGLVDQRVEMQVVLDHAHTLEPLAASGRAALEVVRQLADALSAADTASKVLLARADLKTRDRADVESLRAHALRALLLVAQIREPGATGSTTVKECA